MPLPRKSGPERLIIRPPSEWRSSLIRSTQGGKLSQISRPL